jgi:D-alanyl-D-alanine carboxypeptidase (penicillin-binding protein 5/6)
MNDTAQRIGALDTTAKTPHGLDAAGQFSSAYDLALIARADFAQPGFAALDGTRTAQIPSEIVTLPGHKPKSYGGYQIQNDNRLLTNYPGALGGKTGYTDVARHTYVGVAQRGGHRLVVTMMDGELRPVTMWQQGARLLDWGFAHESTTGVGTLVSPATPSPSPPGQRPPSSAQQPTAQSNTPAYLAGGLLGLVVIVAAGATYWWRRAAARRH